MKKTSQKRFSRHKSLFQILIITSFFVSCSQSYTKSVDQASQNISDSLGCSNVQSKMFDAFYSLVDQEQLVPIAGDIKLALNDKIANLNFKNSSLNQNEIIKKLSLKLDELVDLLLIESINNPNLTWKEQVQKLIEYEMEDSSNSETVKTTGQIQKKIGEIKQLSQSLGAPCISPEPQPAPPVTSNPNVPAILLVFQ